MRYRCDGCKDYFDEDDFVVETGLCFGCNSILLKEIASVEENSSNKGEIKI